MNNGFVFLSILNLPKRTALYFVSNKLTKLFILIIPKNFAGDSVGNRLLTLFHIVQLHLGHHISSQVWLQIVCFCYVLKTLNRNFKAESFLFTVRLELFNLNSRCERKSSTCCGLNVSKVSDGISVRLPL